MVSIAVEVEDLVKTFEPVAVDHIRFQVEKGEIFGFLGPNGAGKSTTIRMLCGLLIPTSDRAVVRPGSAKEPGSSRRYRLHVTEVLSLRRSDGLENLHVFGGMYSLSGSRSETAAAYVLEMAGLGRSVTMR